MRGDVKKKNECTNRMWPIKLNQISHLPSMFIEGGLRKEFNWHDQKTSKTNSTGGGASQTTTSADTNKGSNPKPKEATVVNRIRGTL